MTRPGAAKRPLGPTVAVSTAVAVAVVLFSCSSPTEPDRSSGPQPRDVVENAPELTITVDPTTLTVSSSETSSVVVTVSGSDAPTQVGLSTSLGYFYQDDAGNFIRTLECTPNNTNCPLTNGTVTVKLFPGDQEGSASLVAAAGGASKTALVEIVKSTPLFLERLEPAAGPPSGGTEVTIVGQGFRDTPRVTFGGATATLISKSVKPTQIKVETPPAPQDVPVGATLVVDVSVTLPEDGSGATGVDTLQGAFTYGHGGSTQPPAVISVVPASGQNRGGAKITITGTGFDTNGVLVMFGIGTSPDDFAGVEAEIVGTVRSTEIQVKLPRATPALQNQTVDILIRNLSTGLATLAGSVFTYVDEDIIIEVDPKEASYQGGEVVTIRSQGLDTSATLVVELGGVTQRRCSPSGSTSCVRSTSANGTTTLEVTVRDVEVQDCDPPSGAVRITDATTGEVSVGPDFSYTADSPSLVSIDPAELPESGGTLKLDGTFHKKLEEPNTVVLINGARATIESYTNSRLRIAVPAFTGQLDEADCDDGDGLQYQTKAVDVEVVYLSTGCISTQTGILGYVPNDTSCRPTQEPVPDFDASITGSDLLTVNFTDNSSGSPTEWLWNFGDGSTSTEQNPQHVYAESGTFDVLLRATNSAGSASLTKSITVGLDPAVAAFSFTVDGATVTFTSSSENATDFLWDFGDGFTSTAESTTHTYTALGTFNVTLTASNASSSDSVTVTVTLEMDPPSAAFSFTVVDATLRRVQLDDASTGDSISWSWSFGDSTTSTQQSPLHVYAADGTYTVTLTVTNLAGSSSVQQDVTIP